VREDGDSLDSLFQKYVEDYGNQQGQPQINDLVDRGELRNVPVDELINARPDNGNAQPALVQLASAEGPRTLTGYRQSGAAVKPATADVFEQLHPEFAGRAREFFRLANEAGLNLVPGSVNRSYAEQAKLYADKQAGLRGAYQSLPVAPPGQSAHMGFALDFSGYTPSQLEKIREIARQAGVVYGGNWSGKTFDPIHIQFGPSSEAARYIQHAINPKAGTVDWEAVRATQLPEDFIKRAIAAAQGQEVGSAPVRREAPVEGVSTARGSVADTTEKKNEDLKLAEVKAKVAESRSPNFEKIAAMLDKQSGGGSNYINQVMQSGMQQNLAARQKMATGVAKFDKEQIDKLAEMLKSGKKFAEGGEVHGYNDGGPKLPDRPAYEVTDNSAAVDMTPSNSLAELFAAMTGGRNLENDISQFRSRLPTFNTYGNALLEQKEATQQMNELGRQNLREGYANRNLPQMALGAGQGVLGFVNPALAPINAGFDVLSQTAGKFDPRLKAEADVLGLVGTEGTSLASKAHALEIPKSTWDAILKKYQDVGPQAMAVGLPAATAAAAEKPAEVAVRLGVEPKGNVNLRPMIDAETLKGPDVQTVESFLSQVRSMPGVTKEGFDNLVQKYQGMEPNARISKAEFEKSIPPSEYGKIDIVKEGDKLKNKNKDYENDLYDRATEEFHNDVERNARNVGKDVAEQLGKYAGGWPIKGSDLNDFFNGKPISEFRADARDMLSVLKSELGDGSEKTLRKELQKFYDETTARHIGYIADDLRLEDFYNGDERAILPENYNREQRLNLNHGYEVNDPNYFELGVTHPNQKDNYADYNNHFRFINPDRPEGGMVAHVRGSFMPEGGDISTPEYVVTQSMKDAFVAKPKSAVIEEIQSDVQKQEKNNPVLHQIHATAFKTGVQHALENGATTIYMPAAKTVAPYRHLKASDLAPIYDKEVVKYGIKPLLNIDGVTSKMVGDGAYHEISFTPEAIQAILKGKGQRTPGYADGGLVTDNGQTPDGTGGNQYDAYGDVNAAQGGMIHAVEYNPNNINMIAQRIKEGTYA
jgi:hypothetical protein